MSFKKVDERRANGSLAKLAESTWDDLHSLEMPHSGRPCLAWRETVSGVVGVRKPKENVITDSVEHRLLRYETSSTGSLDSRRRRRGRSIPACPVAVVVVVVVATVLLVAAVTGLAFVVSGLYETVNDLGAKITKCAVETIPRRIVNHDQSFEAFDSVEEIADEPESLFDTTMKLINNDYDYDETELTTDALRAGSTTKTQPIGSEEKVRDGDVVKMEGPHSRVRRDALHGGFRGQRSSSKQLNQTTAAPPGTRSSQEKKGHLLDTAHFQMEFYKDWYDSQTNFSGLTMCIKDERWPTKPEACRDKTITYTASDSPLAFFVPRQNVNQSTGHKKRKRKHNNQSPMEISDQKEGVFGVRESGVYLIHLNILIVDESHNHSLGISLNNQIVLTCPKGGFRCPDINEEGSYKYRVCVIDGVLEINPGDRLQIKTTEKDTKVMFHKKRTSQFKAILLHKTRT